MIMKTLEQPYKLAKINESVKHQNISGKLIYLEKAGVLYSIKDVPFSKMTIALVNFIKRIDIFNMDENTKIYYGHLQNANLGYFVTENEIDILI